MKVNVALTDVATGSELSINVKVRFIYSVGSVGSVVKLLAVLFESHTTVKTLVLKRNINLENVIGFY